MDNYGSYGAVGFCIVRTEESEIRVEDFMLSCRVQGRFIEQAFFNYLVNIPRRQKPQSLWVNFKPTGRNIPAQQVLESLNFVSAGDDTGLRADLTLNAFDCNFITVESSC
jgi:predicted enzyme involved in methoxymalonyl-ACP biosynthesis